ncbi:MAG: hypothetical protein HY060_16365 [Proteobacteria bacterium]|nr:hypothetical protein [Pseudomonadota bacterium]
MIDDLIVSLLIWIAGNATLPPAAPPAIVVRSTTVRPSLSPLAPHLLAFYDEDARTIHLARDWDETDPIDQSVLLHALLHHVQAGAAVPDRSHGAREAEAYRLQALWLSQRGIDFYFAFGVSPSLIARLGLCAGEVAASH